MKWQEYQEAVGELYEQMAEFGTVKKNITIPDRVTGQPRQIDVWWEAKFGGHSIGVLIDAKSRKTIIDVKDVEEVHMLAQAVKAHKAIIVTNNGWTSPAKDFASFCGMDLLILSFDDATDLIIEEKWLMCEVCKEDCVVMDLSNFIEINGLYNWFLGGKCRSCHAIYIHCQDCGDRGIITNSQHYRCYCPLIWSLTKGVLQVRPIPSSDDDDSDEPSFDPNQLDIDFQ